VLDRVERVVVLGQQESKSVACIKLMGRRHIPHDVELSCFFGEDIRFREAEREPARVCVEPLRAIEGLENADVIAEVVQATVDHAVADVGVALSAHEIDLVAHRAKLGKPLVEDECEALHVMQNVGAIGINALVGGDYDDLTTTLEGIHSELCGHALIHERAPQARPRLERILCHGELRSSKGVHVKIHVLALTKFGAKLS